MNHFLKHPALWPILALHAPEPMGTAIDGDSVDRWYAELGMGAPAPLATPPAPQERQQQAPVKPTRYTSPRPSPHLHQSIPRRR